MARAPYLFPSGVQLGADNVVLQARASQHRVDNYAGPLSIKTVVSGRVAWIVQGRELVVDPSSFLVLSAGETYSLNISAAKPVETCCAFFAPGFVEQLALDLTSPLEKSLEAQGNTAPALSYLSALHGDGDRATIGQVQSLAHRCSRMLAPSGFEEGFVELAAAVLRLYQRIREQISRLPAARDSTRQELFRRLLIGREYMHSRASRPVSLATVSRAAGLSLFHFHRGFTQAFQQTPHAYLTHLRLDRARHGLMSGSSVLETCLEVGFSSPSAFSRLFQARFGEPPSAVRRKFRKIGQEV